MSARTSFPPCCLVPLFLLALSRCANTYRCLVIVLISCPLSSPDLGVPQRASLSGKLITTVTLRLDLRFAASATRADYDLNDEFDNDH